MVSPEALLLFLQLCALYWRAEQEEAAVERALHTDAQEWTFGILCLALLLFSRKIFFPTVGYLGFVYIPTYNVLVIWWFFLFG